MNSFNYEISKQIWENSMNIEVDVNNEMEDLLKIYTEGFDHMVQKEKSAIEYLVDSMKRFVEIYDKKREVEKKLNTLKSKMKVEEEDEEGE